MSLRQRVHAFMHPDARAHEVQITGGRQIPAALRAESALRRRATPHHAGDQTPKRGMWVRWSGRTGILTDIERGDIATVMLVDDVKGENVLVVHQACSQLRQAYFEEIPTARRPDLKHALKFGYTQRP